MKKIIFILCLLLIGCQAYSSAWNPSDEVKALRTVKNAKIKVINSQIKEKTNYIQKITLDETLSETEKNIIYTNTTQEINELNKQKRVIEKQYKNDKRNTKFPYKYFNKKQKI